MLDDNKVVCVVDADIDYATEAILKNKHLRYTEFSSLEMYAFDE